MVQSEKNTDNILKEESPDKWAKEEGNKNRLEQGYEEQLNLKK